MDRLSVESTPLHAGIGLMSFGVFLFCVNDAIGKWLVATYPVGEFLAIRAAATLILLAPFIWHAGRAVFLSAPRPGLQLLRMTLGTTEVALSEERFSRGAASAMPRRMHASCN